MADNLALGPEANAHHALALLRETPPVGPIAPGAMLAPDIFIDADPEGETTIEGTEAPGALVGLKIEAPRPGRWLGLHMALGPLDLTDRSVFGFVARTQSPRVTTMRVALRSGHEGGFDDSFFGKQLVAFGENSTHVDLLQLARHSETIPTQAPWRDLILFLPAAGCELVLQDLRLFIV